MPLSDLYSPAVTLTVFAVGYFSPPARQRRRRRHAADERLLGKEQVTDRSGAIITPSVPGLAATVDSMAETVTRASLLNGKGDQLVNDVAWLRRTLASHVEDKEAHRET